RAAEASRTRRPGTRRRAASSKRKPSAPGIPASFPSSAAFVARADEAVRSILAASSPLSGFLARAGTLTVEQRRLLVDQAIVLLEGFYVHLPLKRAMHAVDPLQRLRLRRQRFPDVGGAPR